MNEHGWTHYEALGTPNLSETSLSVASLGDKEPNRVIFIYIIEEVARAHAQNAPLERFLSITGLEIESRL